MHKKMFWPLIGPLLLCLTLLCVDSVSASAPTASSTPVVQGDVTTSDPATRSYWTLERQKSAISVDTLVEGQQVLTSSPSPLGPAVIEPPTVPASETVASQNRFLTSGIQSQAHVLSYPYSFPWSTVGKVFFTDPLTKLNYVCSGTAVTSNNRSTVDTAGHCVAAGGQRRFYTNWVFCPQYYYSCLSGNLWIARLLLTHSNWYNKGWLAYNYGEAIVRPNSRGYLVNAIGGAGWAYNQPYNQYYSAFGFPAAFPFDGSRMWYCLSAFYRYNKPSSGPTALGITCNMTGGASGGGWLISIRGIFGYVNGHNDYKYTNDPAHVYSPYYGNDWFLVFNAAQNS